jgi:hypothetical protein
LTLFGRLGRVPTFLVPIITPLLLTTAGSFFSPNNALEFYNSELENLLEIKAYKQAFRIGEDFLIKPFIILVTTRCYY